MSAEPGAIHCFRFFMGDRMGTLPARALLNTDRKLFLSRMASKKAEGGRVTSSCRVSWMETIRIAARIHLGTFPFVI